ncbi:hypothetical protein ACQ86N_00730 [Puia sp. P3]|uniref:hypothetical protein n=1 Tax=Puia sp. P3 TaxID=3423952 RepID=UPI003D6781A8
MVAARPEVRQDSDRVALQYGPILYCVESADNGGVWDFVLPRNARFTTDFDASLLGGVNKIGFDAVGAQVSADGQSLSSVERRMTAIPYCTWGNRGADAMQVWLPRSFRQLLP